MQADRQPLDAALLVAHASGDACDLAHLYTKAAENSEQDCDTEAACFFLTHAYVFALEAGLAEAGALNKRLAAYGRDVVQADLMS